ncbi:MAG: aminotransferase class I/II-fold pyridoxal phosphate-dependent enzyme [Acidimicrobiia bacterium]|nr:aminotransferase class I/II-fold pyridoxal phosphate-dependent enzyme [Acidimicrobiia bacterium]
MAQHLSKRALKALANPPAVEYIRAHHENMADAYDAATNPDGYIGLCIAENKLVWDLLEPKLAECRDLEHYSLGYDAMIGSIHFRSQLAEFMGRTILGRKIDPEDLAVLNGAGSVLELLFYVLCNPGDGVLVPTPSYTGFWADIETRDELSIIPVHCSSEDGFRLTPHLLDTALDNADRPVKALLYTNPNNPLGEVYSAEQVHEILAWAHKRGIHVVLDEIYALSVFGDADFTSGAFLRPDMGELLHIVWAFSKDFGMSGLRCGVLFTENAAVHQAVDMLSYWAAVSGDTQSLLMQMLADDEWVDSFVTENRRRLRSAYAQVTAVLDEYGVEYMPADAAFFFLVDVRPLMEEVSWEAEDALWRRLLAEERINLTPGTACRNGEPGFMRLVFSSTPTDALVEGARRLGRFAQKARS